MTSQSIVQDKLIVCQSDPDVAGPEKEMRIMSKGGEFDQKVRIVSWCFLHKFCPCFVSRVYDLLVLWTLACGPRVGPRQGRLIVPVISIVQRFECGFVGGCCH